MPCLCSLAGMGGDWFGQGCFITLHFNSLLLSLPELAGRAGSWDAAGMLQRLRRLEEKVLWATSLAWYRSLAQGRVMIGRREGTLKWFAKYSEWIENPRFNHPTSFLVMLQMPWSGQPWNGLWIQFRKVRGRRHNLPPPSKQFFWRYFPYGNRFWSQSWQTNSGTTPSGLLWILPYQKATAFYGLIPMKSQLI